MDILQLVVTDVGRAALVNPDGPGFNAVTVVEIGVTDQPFIAANTLTSLPGELKRVSTLSGQQVDDQSINLVMRDDSNDAYVVTGFGLYLEDGTLFAAFSAVSTLVQKSALASILLTIDVAFADVAAELIQFGDMSWTNPQATETLKGVMEIATPAEVAAGTDHTRAVTPLTLHQQVRSRTITGGGLVTGGGDLTGNRVLTVSEASSGEVLAGLIGTKVVTPRRLKEAIDALVGGAPGALDTLIELSQALGDDPDFAATVANQLALKASITYVDAQMAAARTQLLVERAGTFVWVGYDHAGLDPATMVLASGQLLSRVDDARLFAKFGTEFGVGDGATTFGIPEVRGEFFRALDLGRGINPGRVHGSFEAQSIESHSHSLPVNADDGTGNGFVEDAAGTNTPRTASTGLTGGAETRPRNVAWPVAIWR